MGRSVGASGTSEQHVKLRSRALVGRFSALTGVYLEAFDMNCNDQDHGCTER